MSLSQCLCFSFLTKPTALSACLPDLPDDLLCALSRSHHWYCQTAKLSCFPFSLITQWLKIKLTILMFSHGPMKVWRAVKVIQSGVYIKPPFLSLNNSVQWLQWSQVLQDTVISRTVCIVVWACTMEAVYKNRPISYIRYSICLVRFCCGFQLQKSSLTVLNLHFPNPLENISLLLHLPQ